MRTDKVLEQEIDQIMDAYVSPEGPGIVVLIGRNDRVLVRKAYGLANVERSEPLRPENRFIIASVTKQFVGMCMMMLQYRGFLDYDEPIVRFFPDFPAWKYKVTIRHLLQHTSGIQEYLTAEFWKEVNEQHVSLTQDDLLNRIRSFTELEFEPGSRWRYCNSNYILLGAIVEKCSGKSFAQFAKENIFDPLEMRDTFVGESGEMPERLATGYEYKSKTQFKKAPYNRAVVGWADGNIISTVDDLFIWAQALSSDKILPLEVLSQAFVPWNAIDPGETRYGFGHLIGERRGVRELHHSGSTLGYNALLSRFPDEKLVIVMLSNAAGIGLDKVMGEIVDVMLGDKMLPLVPVELCEEHLKEKTGLFYGKPREREMVLEVKYSPEKRGITATTFYDGQPIESHDLLALSRDLFLADKRTDTYVEFVRDHDGSVRGCQIKCVGRVTNLLKRAVQS